MKQGPDQQASDQQAPDQHDGAPADEQERWQVLTQLEDWLERPMLVLSFVWLSLVIIELIWTTSGVFELLGTIIWIVFILEFLLRFARPRRVEEKLQPPGAFPAMPTRSGGSRCCWYRRSVGFLATDA